MSNYLIGRDAYFKIEDNGDGKVGGKVSAKAGVCKKEYFEHFNWDERKALRQLSKMKFLALIGDNGEASNSPVYRYVIVR